MGKTKTRQDKKRTNTRQGHKIKDKDNARQHGPDKAEIRKAQPDQSRGNSNCNEKRNGKRRCKGRATAMSAAIAKGTKSKAGRYFQKSKTTQNHSMFKVNSLGLFFHQCLRSIHWVFSPLIEKV